MKVSAVEHSRFEWWYPRFEQHTFKSTIVALPEAFLDWLRFVDGIAMDDTDFPIAWAGREISNDELLLDDTPLDLLLDARDQRDSLSMPKFVELKQLINDAIKRHGGEDATWMSATGSVKSTCAEEIFLLLKSSDCVTYDLHHAYDLCSDRSSIVTRYYKSDESEELAQAKQRPKWPLSLVLRKWYRLVPGMEFRCFVGARVLLGISQRDFLNYYPFLEAMREQIIERISDLFDTVIEPTFPEDDYVFDVYMDKNQRVWLVDFNVFSPVTDGLLFAWPDLQRRRDALATRSTDDSNDDGEDDDTELRILSREAQGIRPSAATASAVPIEAIDITTTEGLMQLIQLQQQQQQQHGADSSDSDSER